MSQAIDPAAALSLAQELGWPGTPQGEDARAFALLLDDEFEKLAPAPRKSFATRLRSSCEGTIGRDVLICRACQHVVLNRFGPDNGLCRVCGVGRLEGGAVERVDHDDVEGLPRCMVLSAFRPRRPASVTPICAAGEDRV